MTATDDAYDFVRSTDYDIYRSVVERSHIYLSRDFNKDPGYAIESTMMVLAAEIIKRYKDVARDE